jgi:EmrB/QacA subfamily drug resistance transporter
LQVTEVAVQAPGRERTGLLWWTVAITSVALLAVTLDNLVVTTALPTLQQHFDASIQSLEWSVNAYALGFAVFLLGGRSFGDRFGHRLMFVFGLAIFTAASAGCALAPNVEVFDAARAVQGVGGGLIAPLTLVILGDAFRGRRGVARGLWWGIGGIAVGLGPLVGGVMLDRLDWQWIFWVNVPIGIVAVAVALAGLQETRIPGARVDLWSLLLLGAGLAAIVWGVIRGSEIGWTSKQVLPAIGAGALWVLAFAAWQLASPAATRPLRARRKRQFVAINVASLVAFFGLFGSTFLLMQFLQLVRGDSALRAGLSTAPAIGATVLLAPLAGALCARLGTRPFVVLGLMLQAGGLGWFAYASEVDVTYMRLLPGFIAFGAGLGLFLPGASSALLESVAPELEDQASCANLAVRAAGGALGVAALMTILLAHGSYASEQHFTDGFVRALWVGCAVIAGGFVVSLLLPGRRPAREVVATVLEPRASQAFVLAEQRIAQPEHIPTEHRHELERGSGTELDEYTCPVCQGQGWVSFHPRQDPGSATCPRCYGHGQVLTGSHVPAYIVRDCPDCEARGYMETQMPGELPQVQRAVAATDRDRIALEGADAAADASTSETAPRTVPGFDELRRT